MKVVLPSGTDSLEYLSDGQDGRVGRKLNGGHHPGLGVPEPTQIGGGAGRGGEPDGLSTISDLDQTFTGRKQLHDVRPERTQELLKPIFRGIPGGDPEDLGWGTMSFEQRHEVGVLCSDGGGGPSPIKDDPVRGLAKPEVADMSRIHAESRVQPARQAWGKLGVDPDGHAARVG